jgi:hypothetical protein
MMSLAGAAVAAPNKRGRNTGEGLDTIGGKFLAKGGGRGGILNCGLGKGSGVGLGPGGPGNSGGTLEMGAHGSNCTSLRMDGLSDDPSRGCMGRR